MGKEMNMSEQIDQFCDNLKTRLNAIEKRILDAKAALIAAPQSKLNRPWRAGPPR